LPALCDGHQLLLDHHLDLEQVTTIGCTALDEIHPIALTAGRSARIAHDVRRGIGIEFHDRDLVGRHRMIPFVSGWTGGE
jgi:hypothetical protein